MRNNVNFMKSEVIENPFHQELAFVKKKGEERFQTKKQNPQLSQLQALKTERPKMDAYLSTNSNHYSDIFCKSKRKQFSGYKPYNMNVSKMVKFHYNKNIIQGYKTPRKYQENLKNIMRLRKKFSLEPIELRTPTKTSNDGHKSELISAKKQLSLEELTNNKLPQKQVRQILRDVQKEHFFYLQIQNHQNKLKTCNLKGESMEDPPANLDNLAVPTKIIEQRVLNKPFNKICFFKSKETVRQIKRKEKAQSILNFKSHDKLIGSISADKPRYFDLRGWSFYGNDKLEEIKDEQQRSKNQCGQV